MQCSSVRKNLSAISGLKFRRTEIVLTTAKTNQKFKVTTVLHTAPLTPRQQPPGNGSFIAFLNKNRY